MWRGETSVGFLFEVKHGGRQRGNRRSSESYFDTNLLIYALLFILDLFLKFLDCCTIWRRAIGLQDLNIPGKLLARPSQASGAVGRVRAVSYSSVKGVIFFSSISSSANFFWYFSQF
jgi:hypothetical protein